MVAGQTYTSTFQVKSSSGELINSDLLPTSDIYLDGVLTSIIPNITNVSTGVYTVSFDVPSNWLAGDSVDIHTRAQVNSFTLNVKKNGSVVHGQYAPVNVVKVNDEDVLGTEDFHADVSIAAVTPEQVADELFGRMVGTP